MPKRSEVSRRGMPTTILRLPKKDKYFKVANSVFGDQELSWEACGVMGYLLSKPDNWQVRLFDLLRRARSGRGTQNAPDPARELESAGYSAHHSAAKMELSAGSSSSLKIPRWRASSSDVS